MLADANPAVRAYLGADPDVLSLVGSELYGEQLPAAVAASMPANRIVVRSAGGPGSMGYLTVSKFRYDIHCFGATPADARQVYLAVVGALKQMVSHTEGAVKLLSAWETAGPFNHRDPDVNWPYVLTTWIVSCRDESVGS